MSDLLKPELQVQRPEPSVCLRRDCLDCFALGAQPGKVERALGPASKAWSSFSVVHRRFVDVEDPSLATIG